jgi:lipopolysaccharide transport system ATP-binding protein
MEKILSLSHVGFEYKTRTGFFKSFKHSALKDISLDLHKGETLGILGRNGSGKSTLLQILAGLIEPTQGSIQVSDPGLTRSMLSLGLGFKQDLTGLDNTLISLVLQGKSKTEAQAMVEQIEDFSELGKFFYQPVKTYSAGMRARLGFATGVCSEVELFLIDEVLSVGDISFREKAEQSMMNKLKNTQTVAFVSQSPTQVVTLCDRAIWIHDGLIAAEGDPDNVAAEYISVIGRKKGGRYQ